MDGESIPTLTVVISMRNLVGAMHIESKMITPCIPLEQLSILLSIFVDSLVYLYTGQSRLVL